MRWQKRLRVAIAVFVVVFAAVVVVSLRKGHKPAGPVVEAPTNLDPKAVAPRAGPARTRTAKRGKVTFQLKFGNQKSYADGRLVLGGGVNVVLPDKDGRQVTVESQDADVDAAARQGDRHGRLHRRRQADHQRRHRRHLCQRHL